MPVTIPVPEPNTWREILRVLDKNPRSFTLEATRVGVLEYGAPNQTPIQGPEALGVEGLQSPVC